MIPDLTPAELESSLVEQTERQWTVCDSCPGIENCENSGWQSVLRREPTGICGWARQCDRAMAREKQQQLDALVSNSRMGKRFRERTFSSFEPRPGTERGLEAAKRFVASDHDKGLIFVGPVGSGKTHLAAAIANDLLSHGTAVVFATVPDMLAELRSAIDDHRQDEVMNALRTADLLVLDDIGAERVTGWVQEQWYRLINYRYEALLPIVATSNLTPDDLRESLGERIVSRLIEMCDWVLVDAPDYRTRGLGSRSPAPRT